MTVWAKGKPPQRALSGYAGLDGLLVVIEVVSPDRQTIDHVIKKSQYAAAGVVRVYSLAAAFMACLYSRTLASDPASVISATDRYEPSSP